MTTGTAPVPSSIPASDAAIEHESYGAMVWRRFRRHRLALVGAVVVALLCVSAVLANVIAPYDPTFLDTSKRFLAPFQNMAHPLGTDDLGRDTLSRLLHASPRLLLEEHGRFFPEVERPLRRSLNRLLLRRLTHRFVAVSDDVRERLAVYEGLPRAAIEVVPNGVPRPTALAPAARAALRASLGLPVDAFVVGTVGRFDPIKNLPLLVDALARAAPQLPRLRALLVGDGAELAAVRQRVAAAALDDRVCFTGFRADARELTQCMDLFVLSSHSEGLSIALLDAQAAGVPAAVTAVGGNPDVVVHGETGWVVAPGDAAALAAAIVAGGGDARLCAGLGAAAVRRHAERFDWEAMLRRYRELYRGMLEPAS